MKNGWTGGQYSLFRAICGLYLLIHFAMLLPYGAGLFSDRGVLHDSGASPLARLFSIPAISDSPPAAVAVLILAMIAALFFILGLFDRIAALVMWYVLACLPGRNPLMWDPSLPFMWWLLIAHACLPKAPYGSIAARGRIDPRGGWRFPPALFAATWIVLAFIYAYGGYTRIMNPSWRDGTAMACLLQSPIARPGWMRDLALAMPAVVVTLVTWTALSLNLLFAPFALLPRRRPWLWLAMVVLLVGLALVFDYADLICGWLVFHLFAFDPAWVRGSKPATTDTVFFDGTCGLCHRSVRFLLAEDRAGTAFQFSPLGGPSFASAFPDPAGLPDSVVVRTAAGETLTRSTGMLHVMKRLGGLWRVLATIAGVVPRPARDLVYDFIARVRYRIFGRTNEACPLLPSDLRTRFVP